MTDARDRDREFWLTIRRAMLMMARAIEARYCGGEPQAVRPDAVTSVTPPPKFIGPCAD